jgi:hypothetical protein
MLTIAVRLILGIASLTIEDDVLSLQSVMPAQLETSVVVLVAVGNGTPPSLAPLKLAFLRPNPCFVSLFSFVSVAYLHVLTCRYAN